MKLTTGKKVGLGKAFRGHRGQSMVEFAAVAPLFFLLVFGITDFGLMFFRQETLEYAIREAGRYAVTGRSNTGSTRVQSIIDIAKKYAVGIPIDGIQVNSGTTTNSAGGPRQPVTVTLTSNYYFITPFIGKFFPGHDLNGKGGYYTFTVSTTFMNEPFPPGTGG
jgi:Flp pilus assembly protein TadG